MTARNKQLRKLDRSGENDKRARNQGMPSPVGKTESKAGGREDCEMFKIMWSAGFRPQPRRN